MELRLDRYAANAVSTLGKMHIDDVFECFTCEDAYHVPKIHGQTRIPSGSYRVFLRELGTSRFDSKYTAQFGVSWYYGMLQLEGVPGFEGVEIHIGNSAKDTDGCILVGTIANETADHLGSYTISHSTDAFEAFYPKVRDALLRGEEVNIEVRDISDALVA